MTPLNRRLAYGLLTVIGLAPFVISSRLGLVDPFTHGFISASLLMLNNGNLGLSNSPIEFVPASSFLVSAISLIAGMAPVDIEYLPVAGPLALASAYLLGRRVFQNKMLALLVADIVSYRFFSFWLYGIWPHAIGHALFLLFVSTLLLPAANRAGKVAILWALYLAINFYSYTTELWILVLLGIILSVAWAQARIDPGLEKKVWRPFSISMITASIVLFLGFNQVVYGGYLPRLSTVQNELVTGVEYYLSTIFKSTPPVQYAWIPPPSPWYLTMLQISWFGLTFVPMLLALRYLKSLRPTNKWLSGLTPMKILGVSLLTVWAADVVAYIPIGGFKASLLRVPILTWPYLSLLLLMAYPRFTGSTSRGRSGIPRRVAVYSVSLVAISGLVFSLTIAGGFFTTSTSHYSFADAGAQWLYTNRPDTPFIYSDQNTQGQYSIIFAGHDLYLEPNHLFQEESFRHLVDPPYLGRPDHFFRGQVLVVNLELVNDQTSAGGWIDFEPLAPHLPAIEGNPGLTQVYSDGTSLMLIGA